MPKLIWIKDVFSTAPFIHDSWKNWVRAENHSGQELMEIVYGQFEEEYQKRALFLLLAPDTELAPFGWNHRHPFHCLYHEIDFRKVEVDLRAHAIYWLCSFIDHAKNEPALKDNRSVLLNAYNQYILQLLEILPVEDNQAETLFAYFSINDPTPSTTNMNDFGYKPLAALWKNPRINEKWKRLAAIEMQKTIKKELRGESVPRESWEGALQFYTHHLQSLLCSTPHLLPFSKEFLADQLNFLTSLEVSGLRLIQPESVTLILNLLTEDEYQSTRNQLIRFTVLRDGHFEVYSEQTEEAAQLILRECDPQIRLIVQTEVNNYRQNAKKIEAMAENEKKAKEALLAPMRKLPDIPPNQSQSEQ